MILHSDNSAFYAFLTVVVMVLELYSIQPDVQFAVFRFFAEANFGVWEDLIMEKYGESYLVSG